MLSPLTARRARRTTALAAALAVAALTASVTGPASAVTTSSTKVRTLSDPAIDESSGLARSQLSSTRLWTHNDSGGGTTIFALDAAGKTTRTFELTNASHLDWEAMASATLGGVPYLYLGDIGDNGKKRSTIFVHRVREPDPATASGSLPYTTYEFRYADGARNAEGMMVNPVTGRLYVVSKVKGAPGGIYAAPATLSTTSVNVLTKVATAPAGMADAVFLQDGQRFVLRGYVSGWLYSGFGATPVRFDMPLKGESVTTDWSPTAILVGSESQYSSIWRVTLP